MEDDNNIQAYRNSRPSWDLFLLEDVEDGLDYDFGESMLGGANVAILYVYLVEEEYKEPLEEVYEGDEEILEEIEPTYAPSLPTKTFGPMECMHNMESLKRCVQISTLEIQMMKEKSSLILKEFHES